MQLYPASNQISFYSQCPHTTHTHTHRVESVYVYGCTAHTPSNSYDNLIWVIFNAGKDHRWVSNINLYLPNNSKSNLRTISIINFSLHIFYSLPTRIVKKLFLSVCDICLLCIIILVKLLSYLCSIKVLAVLRLTLYWYQPKIRSWFK